MMAWKNVYSGDIHTIARFKTIMTLMDSAYENIITDETIRDFYENSADPHGFYYKDRTAEIVLTIKEGRDGLYRVLNCGVISRDIDQALKIAWRKIYDFIESKQIDGCYAIVPKTMESATIRAFYTASTKAWDLEVEDRGSSWHWTLRRGKDKPFIHTGVTP